MANTFALLLFGVSLLLPLWAFIGYPLTVWLLARRQPETIIDPDYVPASVSIIIAAHNEARHIRQKLLSVINQRYWRQHSHVSLQIIVASDGSTDETVNLAKTVGHEHHLNTDTLKVLDLPRGGKQQALNTAVLQASSEILVFTDADNEWLPDTLSALLAPFADHHVGATAGNMQIAVTGDHLSKGDSLYRRFESALRLAESRTGCLVAADGALQALRATLFTPVPPGSNDDFHISTCAPAAGFRIAYAPDALVLDQGVDEAGKQFRRRIRVTLGGLQSLALRARLMNPWRHGRYALALISHKLLRRLAPLALIPLLLSSAVLAPLHPLMALFTWLQLAAYAIAIVGILLARWPLPKPVRLCAFVLVTLTGMAVAVIAFIAGKRLGRWNPQQNR